MNGKPKGILGVVLCLVVAAVVIYSQNVFGVSAGNLEKAARKAYSISDEWEVAKSVGDELAALLFYDQAHHDHYYVIYAKKDGLSFGYHPVVSRGNNAEIQNSVAMFSYESKGEVILSMNRERAKYIGLNDKTQVEVDPDKPLAFVSKNPEKIDLVNSNNESIPLGVVYVSSIQ